MVRLWTEDSIKDMLLSWLANPFGNIMDCLCQVEMSIASTHFKDPTQISPLRQKWNGLAFLENGNDFQVLFHVYKTIAKAIIFEEQTQTLQDMKLETINWLGELADSKTLVAVTEDMEWLMTQVTKYRKTLRKQLNKSNKEILKKYSSLQEKNKENSKGNQPEKKMKMEDQPKDDPNHNLNKNYENQAKKLIDLNQIVKLANSPMFKSKIEKLKHIYKFIQKHTTYAFWRNLDKFKIIIIFFSSQNLLNKFDENYNISKINRIYQDANCSRIFRNYKFIKYKFNSIKRKMSEDKVKKNVDLVDENLTIKSPNLKDLDNRRKFLTMKINMALNKDPTEARLLMQQEDFKLLTQKDLAYLDIDNRLYQLDILKNKEKLLDAMAREEVWKNKKAKEEEETKKKKINK